MLANLMAEHEGKLRADLQSHYGIDLDHAVGGQHTPHHIACLVENLPPHARVYVALNSDNAWTRQDILLASILNNIRGYIWAMSDKRKRGPAPELAGPSWLTEAKKKTLPARVLTIDELLKELEKPRSKNG